MRTRIHKSPRVITEEYFTAAVGYPPVQDDLERSNCSHGRGCTQCGWNRYVNLPSFMSNSTEFEQREEDTTGVDTCLID